MSLCLNPRLLEDLSRRYGWELRSVSHSRNQGVSMGLESEHHVSTAQLHLSPVNHQSNEVPRTKNRYQPYREAFVGLVPSYLRIPSYQCKPLLFLLSLANHSLSTTQAAIMVKWRRFHWWYDWRVPCANAYCISTNLLPWASRLGFQSGQPRLV